MTLWSLFKTMLSNPGYLPDTYYKNPKEIRKVVNGLNRKHYAKNNLIVIRDEAADEES